MCFTSSSILHNCSYQATDNVKYFSYVIVTCIQSTIFFSFMKKYSIVFHIFIQKYLLDNDFLLNIYFQNAVISCASSRSPCSFMCSTIITSAKNEKKFEQNTQKNIIYNKAVISQTGRTHRALSDFNIRDKLVHKPPVSLLSS